MLNIKQYIMFLIILPLLSFALSCENTEDNGTVVDKNTDYLNTKNSTVTGKGDVVDPQPGDEIQLQLADPSVVLVLTGGTQIQYMRPSGSGYSNGSVGDIGIGGEIEYRYYEVNVDYSLHPSVIRPEIVRYDSGEREE